jgi:hypothetical protein
VAIAKIEVRTVSRRSDQAATTTAKAGSSNSGPVALSVARGGRELPLAVTSCRITAPSSRDTNFIAIRGSGRAAIAELPNGQDNVIIEFDNRYCSLFHKKSASMLLLTDQHAKSSRVMPLAAKLAHIAAIAMSSKTMSP